MAIVVSCLLAACGTAGDSSKQQTSLASGKITASNFIGVVQTESGHVAGFVGDEYIYKGVPNADGLPQWEAYAPERGATMVFGNTCQVKYNHDRGLLEVVRAFRYGDSDRMSAARLVDKALRQAGKGFAPCWKRLRTTVESLAGQAVSRHSL